MNPFNLRHRLLKLRFPFARGLLFAWLIWIPFAFYVIDIEMFWDVALSIASVLLATSIGVTLISVWMSLHGWREIPERYKLKRRPSPQSITQSEALNDPFTYMPVSPLSEDDDARSLTDLL